MTDQLQGIRRENHSPGNGGRPPIELSVDKVSDPAEGIAQWNGGDEEIGKAPEVNLMPAAENEAGRQDANRPAMVGHPADSDKPDPIGKFEGKKDFQGVMQVIGKIVKQNVTQSGAKDQSQDGPDKIVLNGFG